MKNYDNSPRFDAMQDPKGIWVRTQIRSESESFLESGSKNMDSGHNETWVRVWANYNDVKPAE